MQLNEQAIELNNKIQSGSKTIYDLLSKRGKAIYFPKKGILSQSADAKGKKINATIGIALDDDGTSMRFKSIADNIKLGSESVFPYAPSYGRQDIREKWREMIYKKNPSLKADISMPVVTNALTHGLNMVAYMFVDEGDSVIMPNLFWENYELIFSNAYGGKLELFDLFKGNGLNVKAIETKLKNARGKKILLLNFPNNPTGYTPTAEEAKEIVNVLKKEAEEGNKIIVITDDAYFGLVYEDGVERESIFSYIANLHENILAVKVDGPTKEDYVWGLRVGFITYGIKNGNKEIYSCLESKTAGAIRGDISNSSNLSQSLLMKAYTSESYENEKRQKFEILKSRYSKVKEVLAEPKYEEEFFALPFNSGYFMCVELKHANTEKVRQTLLQKYSTGVISQGKILRIAFSALKEELIPEIFDNIYHACKESR